MPLTSYDEFHHLIDPVLRSSQTRSVKMPEPEIQHDRLFVAMHAEKVGQIKKEKRTAYMADLLAYTDDAVVKGAIAFLERKDRKLKELMGLKASIEQSERTFLDLLKDASAAKCSLPASQPV